jgi:ABC-type thiamine transport system substrate-binding protein
LLKKNNATTANLDRYSRLAAPKLKQIQQKLIEEASLDIYWPSAGGMANWLENHAIPAFQKYISSWWGVNLNVISLNTKGGDESLVQFLRRAFYSLANDIEPNIDVARVLPLLELLELKSKELLHPLLPTETALLSNITCLSQSDLKPFTSKGITYAIPLYRPTVTFFYHKHLVVFPPENLTALMNWVKTNPHRFTYESPFSPSSKSSGQLFVKAVMESCNRATTPGLGNHYLRELRSYCYPMPDSGDELLKLFKAEQIWLMPFWYDYGWWELEEKANSFAASYYLQDAYASRLTSLVVPKTAKHKTAALLFINFLLSKEMQYNLAMLAKQIPASREPSLWDSLPPDYFGKGFKLTTGQ